MGTSNDGKSGTGLRSGTATVSVIIPAHNKPNFVIPCIRSLNNQERLSEIILIDDASNKDISEIFSSLANIKYYRNTKSTGFIRSVHRGVKKSSGDYLMILNSDTVMRSNALQFMAQEMDKNCAIVGPRVLFHPDSNTGAGETVQCIGVGINVNGIPYHPYMNLPGDSPAVMTPRHVNAVTGAAIMIKREWWDKMRGFDFKFGRGVYEDVDFCWRARKAGGDIRTVPAAVVHHIVHGSQSASNNFYTEHDKNLTALFARHGHMPCDDGVWYSEPGLTSGLIIMNSSRGA